MSEEKKGHPGGHPGGKPSGGHPGGHPGGKPGGGHPGGHPGGKPGGGRPSGPPGVLETTSIEELVDITEKGAEKDGKKQIMNERLWVQFHAFTGCKNTKAAVDALKKSKLKNVVLYEHINDPYGIAIVSMSTDQDFFVNEFRKALNMAPFKSLTYLPEFTMIGRTYSIGFEEDLQDWLIDRVPRITAVPEAPWAVWYPLRRKGEFYNLDKRTKAQIMMEHGMIGRAFGMEGFAKDVRLNCNGVDVNDNDFVIGIIGDDIYPMSKLIETMRLTQQTSKYLEKLGPFWVGKAVYQSNAVKPKKAAKAKAKPKPKPKAKPKAKAKKKK